VALEILVEPDSWDEPLGVTDGPQLVVGGPGSGKTEFLVRRARLLIAERGVHPEEILILSFSRRGAADIRTRVAHALGRSVSRLPASTFHSLAMRILEAHGTAGDWDTVPTLLTGPEQVALVADVLAGEDPTAWPQPFRGLLTDSAFADEITDFILRAAERLVDGAALGALERADWRALPGFLSRYRDELLLRGRIDYGTLQAEAVRLLADPAIGPTIAERIRYVLVDEYQDTTVAQAAIVHGIGGAGNVTAAGDPYQSIYSFRGAELSNVADFPVRFPRSDGTPAPRLVLTTSFRVPAVILDAAVRVTSGAGLPGAAGPMKPAGPGGSVETYGFDQQSNEAEWIAAEIQRLHLRSRIPYGRIAVLVRSKRRFLPELSRALERRRIPHERPDTRLVDHRMVRPVLDLARAAAGSGPDARAALRRVLLGPLGGLTLSAVREIERTAMREGWEQALADSAVPTEIRRLLEDPAWATDLPAAHGFWEVWTAAEVYVDVATNPHRLDDRRAVASFGQALSRLADRDPHATLVDYARTTDAEDFEATPLLEYHGDTERVTLTTLHQSKGMSFDVVFIADAREGVLPDLRTRDSLLGVRHLSPTHGSDDTAYARFRLQEEMRLAYSAMCRAGTRVVWTCTAGGFEGGEGMPSRFIPIVAGTSTELATRPPPPWTRPVTPLEAEAWLRRRLTDPGSPLVDRLVAAAALTGSAGWSPPRPPERFAGVLDRGPDSGLVPPDPTLSASQADSYTRCPRRYAFERRLRVDRGGSNYQGLGSTIHEALEIAERAARDGGASHAQPEDAIAALDAVFDPTDFGGGALGEAWRARAHRIVERLYDQWPGEGPGVDFEAEFEVVAAGARWFGRIDRVERRGDALHVVDYKTGTSVPTISDAAVSIQLGLYLLGLREAADAPVLGAEFWYPADRLDDGKSVSVRALDLDRLDEVGAALEAAADGIRAERWEPNPARHCDRCPVRIVCPEWPEGQEAFLP
jgi:superfamily I DNA/RNA helicase/RecB family exonuclease